MTSEDDPDLLKLARSVADGEEVIDEAIPDPSSGNLRRLAELSRLFSRCRDAPVELPFQWAGLEVESVVGRGGFGTVYRARDPVLARYVALKLIDRDALDDAEFMSEARRLARVRHPNVLSVHGVEQAEGRVGLWADLLEGETLEQRLCRGPIDRSALLPIAAQVTEALRAVHAAGLVHGDVKAGNVMIDDDGHVTLMDFGAAHRAADGLMRFGSPRNMAPECLDAQSGSFAADIYAFGALLYRLATGRHAFEAPDRAALVERKRSGDLDLRPLGHLQRPLRALIAAMMAPEPGGRPDLGEIAARIDWLRATPVRRLRRALVGVVALCLVVIAAWMIDREAPVLPANPPFQASVAVMPFDDLDAGAARGDFVLGLSDVILHELSGVSGLKVAGRYSAQAAAGIDRAELGETLGVDHVLQGSVRRAGEELRVYAELVRAADGSQVWSETFDRHMDDVFRIQDSIAAEVARALRGVAIDRGRSDARRTDVDNYEIYLRGLSLLNRRGSDNVLRSIEYFRDVVDRDPGFAPAWSGLASAYAVLPSYTNAPPVSGEEARRAALRAIDLDPDDALALGVLATRHTGRREWLQAERLYRRALAAEPGNSTLRMWYGELMAETGRLVAKQEQFSTAVELDPLAPAQRGNYGWALLVNNDFEGAARECRIAWDLGLEAVFVWMCVHESLLLQEKFSEAERWIEHLPLGSRAKVGARRLLAAMRDPDDADKRALAVRTVEEGLGANMPVENAAMALALMGETEAAWTIIDKTVSAGEYGMVRSLFAPHFSALQNDPRFVGLMRRLGLVDYWQSSEWGPICEPVGGELACHALSAE